MKKSECTFNQHSSRLEKLQLDECWLKLCCIHVPRVFPTQLLLKFSCQRFLGSFMSICYQFLPWIISMIPELPALLHFESPHLKPPFISTQLSRQCKALTQTELVAKTQAPFVFLWRPWRRTSALLSSQCQPTCMIEDTVWSSRHLMFKLWKLEQLALSFFVIQTLFLNLVAECQKYRCDNNMHEYILNLCSLLGPTVQVPSTQRMSSTKKDGGHRRVTVMVPSSTLLVHSKYQMR